MATQRDIQQLIQSLVPSGVNNGNPNTVYNVPPPTLDAQGNWAAGLLPQAASIPGLNLPGTTATFDPWQPPAWDQAGGIPGVIQPVLPGLPGGGGGSGGGGGGGGGYTPPGTGGPTPPTPVITEDPGTITSPGNYDPPSLYSGLGGTSASWWPSGALGFYGGMSGPGSSIGGNAYLSDRTSSVGAGSVVNVLGGLLGFGNNNYLRGSGSWDTSNILANIGQAVTGIPFNTMLNNLANSIANGGGTWAPQWLRQMAINHGADNAENQAILSEQAFDRNTMIKEMREHEAASNSGWAPSTVGQAYGAGMSAREINNMIRAGTLSGTKFGSKSSIASRSPYFGIIEGEAAQEFLDSMAKGKVMTTYNPYGAGPIQQ